MARIKAFILFMLCAAALFSGTTASAASVNLPAGILIGDNDGIQVTPEGNYFIYADSLRAGDVITKTVTIRNTENDKPFALYMSAEPMAVAGPINLLDKISLKLTLAGKTLYEGRLYGDEGNPHGVATNMVTSRISLGTYAFEDSTVMEITLTLSPDIPSSYFYNKSVAEIGWKFTAIKDETGKVPATGDEFNIWLYMTIIVISALCLLIAGKKTRGDVPTPKRK